MWSLVASPAEVDGCAEHEYDGGNEEQDGESEAKPGNHHMVVMGVRRSVG